VTATPHRVRRLRWRVRAGSRDAAFEVRARLRELHDADLLDVFERAFDAAASGDAIVHLQRLELAVTVPDIDAIGAALAQALVRQAVRSAPTRMLSPASLDDPRLQPTNEDSAAGINGLLDYLSTGVLPWPLANLGRITTRDELIGLVAAHRDRVASEVPASLDAAIAYLFRWLQLTPAAGWTAIARLVGAPPPAPDVIEPITALAAIAAESGPRLPDAAPEAMAAAVLAVSHLDRRTVPIAVRQVSSVFAPFVSLVGDTPRTVVPIDLGSRVAPVAAWIAARLTGGPSRPPVGPAAMSPSSPPVSMQSAFPAAAESPPGAPPDVAPAPDPRNIGSNDDRPGLVVDHAGLVIMHPFLPRLFERLGVAPHGTTALDRAVLSRAAALLAYAAIGDDNPLDFELGLIKVLLGLRPDAVVLTPASTLDAADRDEVDALLGSVIEHWKVLKHTSIAGLRGSFLQRRGLLGAIDGSWRLRVEPDSFDVLIDRLPWALGPIKLPWMTTLLFTEWARS
jgi:hypothetical protein